MDVFKMNWFLNVDVFRNKLIYKGGKEKKKEEKKKEKYLDNTGITIVKCTM